MVIRKSSAPGVSKLPRSAFAYPKTRSFPINSTARQRSALARARMSSNSASYSHVAGRIRAYNRAHGRPNAVASVGPKRGTTSRPGYRGARRGR
jgi:hypothetical protein